MNEYKKGEKVVVVIDNHDANLLRDGKDIEFGYEQILGKLEGFQPQREKIEFTSEMKREFDDLRENVTYLKDALLKDNQH